jgi:two-component system, NtrC family, response regulator AtoC
MPEVPSANPSQQSAVAGQAPRHSVLLAEDEAMVYETLQAALLRKGFVVRLATTTQEALDFVAAEAFDVIISDYFMPGGGGGDDVLRAALALPRRPKIIMSTGSGNDELVARLLQAGADRCLEKPFGIRELLDTVAEVLAE